MVNKSRNQKVGWHVKRKNVDYMFGRYFPSFIVQTKKDNIVFLFHSTCQTSQVETLDYCGKLESFKNKFFFILSKSYRSIMENLSKELSYFIFSLWNLPRQF